MNLIDTGQETLLANLRDSTLGGPGHFQIKIQLIRVT